MSDTSSGRPQQLRKKPKKRGGVIKVEASSRLIQPADSVPRARPSWLRPDHNNERALRSARRSTADMLRAKGISRRFWPPMGKGGEPVVRWLGRSGAYANMRRLLGSEGANRIVNSEGEMA